MRRFESRAIREAIQYAQDGGQALHVWTTGSWPGPKPRCFVNGRQWGHLLDRDEARLLATARRLGVRVVRVSQRGTRTQHVDLCERPLAQVVAAYSLAGAFVTLADMAQEQSAAPQVQLDMSPASGGIRTQY